MESSSAFLNALSALSETIRRLSMRDFLLFVKKAGLSVTQMGVLIRIHQAGPCAVSDVAAHVDVTNAAASQMVEKLVQQGWLKRSEDPNDRRSKQVALTNRGSDLVEQSMASGQRWMVGLAKSFSAEQQAEIIHALGLLQNAVQNIEGFNKIKCQPD
jgi:DNA-binding MarR family transcriptional regulator